MKPYFKELLGIFNNRQVEYLVIGAHAVIFYTVPRYTKDHDVWVNPTEENAHKVYDALIEFGAPLEGVTPEDFTVPNNVYQMGVTTERIDVIASIAGLDFNECWSRRVDFDYDGVMVHFIAKEDLILNKKKAGRPQDLLDVDKLEKE